MTMLPTTPPRSDPRSLIRYACVAAAVTIVAVWTLYLVRGPLLLIYVSMLFATGMAPLVQKIERQRVRAIRLRRVPRALAILVIYASVIGVLAAIAAAVIPPLIVQVEEFWKQLPSYMTQAQEKLQSWGLIAPDVSFTELLKQSPGGGSNVVGVGGNVVGVVISALGGFLGAIFAFVSVLLLTFYFLVESENILKVFVRLFAREHREQAADVSAKAAVKISAWLGGQLLLGLIIGGMTAIGFALMGVPYFFVLAVIAAIGELIPMVGPLLSAIPAVGVALTVSPGLALGVAGYCLVLQLLENNVLVPKVMGETVGLSAVTVIISLAIGSELLGFIGALLAVPTAAIIQVLFEELYLAEKDPA
jgi:predicted PurR-regulated permease PerM